MMERDLVLSLVLFGIFFFVLFYIYFRAQQRIKKAEMLHSYERSLLRPGLICGRQENDVYNISGRVNGQDNWPTHDHHVSIDSFVFPPEYQAKDPRFAPPPYTEVDLPTYEEAISACASHKTVTLPVPVHSTPPPPRVETA